MSKAERLEVMALLKETPVNLSLTLESLVEEQGITYIDALLVYCEQNNVEPDYIPALITPYMKGKLENEALGLHLLKRKRSSTVQLPE